MPFYKKLEIREHNGPIYSVVGSGKYIFTSSGDKYVVKWDLENGTQERFSIKMDYISYCLAYANDKLYIGTKNGEFYIVSDITKSILYQRKISNHSIHSILITDGKIIVGNANGEVLFLDNQLNLIHSLNFESGKIRDLKLLDDNRLLIVSQDGYLRIVLFDTTELEHRFTAHEKGANKALLVGEELFTVGKDGYLKIWDWKNEILLHSWPIHYETIYDIKQVGDYIVTASRDKSIKIWKYNGDLKLEHKITSRHLGHSYSVNAIHVVDTFNFCTVGDDKRIISWSLEKEDDINLLHFLKHPEPSV